ncbi:ABC transporter substrate-binding protein [Parasphingorhabdus sp.]|uniref:ABC transporter substrate-binding protein n=1 Tax=Parasphingorhabdus sp. TaxID=2709688 RepID=UPI00326412D0
MNHAAATLSGFLSSSLAAAGLFLSAPTSAQAEVVSISTGVKPPAVPKRIVSINPCSDALLMHLASAGQIAAISHYSHDKRATSISLHQALNFRATSGTAEEILAQRPDLVIASSFVKPATEQALKRLNIALIKLSIPQSVAESQQQISELANILGTSKRGQRLNKRISAAFAKARPSGGKPVPALIWRSGGLVPGSGTLPDELLRRTGFQNMSASYGLSQWDVLPLEHLISRPPRVLFSNAGEAANGNPGQRDRMLSHPIISKLSKHIAIADYPARLLHCAGPTLIDAVNTLSAARRKLDRQP